MEKIIDLFEKNNFLKILFNSIPMGVMLVDESQRVQTVNNFMRQTFNVHDGTLVDKEIGKVIHCINNLSESSFCTLGEHCQNCKVRIPAKAALEGQEIQRSKANVQLLLSEKMQNKEMLVTAVPVEFEGNRYALVLLEDVTELSMLRRQLEKRQGLSEFIGRDPQITELREKIRVLAEVDAPVLIQGESGTGKELVATAIHQQGPKADKPYIVVNCGALPETLLESELFGHVRGAFTGAIKDKKGRFELADGGTIFLDEIGDISPLMQVKLLRVLQEGTFVPVGSEKTIQVHVRVVSATNKDIRKEVENGKFREDLYYRLCVVPLHIPPLRERKGDIHLLVEHMLKNTAYAKVIEISPSAIDLLVSYEWPGNIRELQNVLQYALVNCTEPEIRPEHILPALQNGYLTKRISRRKPRKRKLTPLNVRDAIKQSNGNRVKMARLLGVSRSTLYRFIDENKIK